MPERARLAPFTATTGPLADHVGALDGHVGRCRSCGRGGEQHQGQNHAVLRRGILTWLFRMLYHCSVHV